MPVSAELDQAFARRSMRTLNAPPSASSPANASMGTWLAVCGSCAGLVVAGAAGAAGELGACSSAAALDVPLDPEVPTGAGSGVVTSAGLAGSVRAGAVVVAATGGAGSAAGVGLGGVD